MASGGRRYILGAGDTYKKVRSTAHLTPKAPAAKLAPYEALSHLFAEGAQPGVGPCNRMKLNAAAVTYLNGLISAGHVVQGAWSFSATDGNRLLDSDNDGDGGARRDQDADAGKDRDWSAFGSVHLGIDESANERTKGRYGYPCAKKDASGRVVVYLHGLLGAISRAGQQGEKDIEAAARKLYAAALRKVNASGMKRIPSFKAGRHTSKQGESVEMTEADLRATAAAYDPNIYETPLVIGHPKTDAPAYGYAQSFEFTEDGLDAIPHQVDPEFEEMVRAGRFKRISLAWYRPDSDANPVPGVWYPRHIGFLGAQPPAVKGLRAIEFNDAADDTLEVEFAELDAMTVARVMRSLREWILAKFGRDDADQAVPSWYADNLMIEAARDDDDVPGTSPAFSEEIDPVTKEELEKREQAIAAREKKVQEKEVFFSERETEARREKAVEFVESLKGKILPREKAPIVEVLMALQGADQVEFSEGESTVKRSPDEILREHLSNLPERVDFAERSGMAGNETGKAPRLAERMKARYGKADASAAARQ